MQASIKQDDIERSHRVGTVKDKNNTPRTRQIIVRFKSERMRDSVFKALQIERIQCHAFGSSHIRK